MLCRSCRRQLERGASHCGSCGAPLSGAPPPLELILQDATRVPLLDEVTIGRAPGSTVVLGDPSVSRTHARITAGAVLCDAGSSHGTWLDGERVTGPVSLRDGASIRLGDQELLVERRRDAEAAGRTIVVPLGASLVMPAAGAGAATATGVADRFGGHPRMRSGHALKRLDASEGPRRWVLRDLDSGAFLALADDDAGLVSMLDGSRSLSDLVGEAERRHGAQGPARLARLLADLGERGLLAGVGTESGSVEPAVEPSRLRRLAAPREKVFEGIGERVDALYEAGGWALFTRPARAVLAGLAVVGLASFAALVAGTYGTPFVVADKIGWGGLVFVLGRLAVAGVHETAHALTMASVGRRVQRAGLRRILVFPFAFVDTSEAWFESRRRRIAVSAAGPVADVCVGGLFSVATLLAPEGTVRDVFFNVAFAAYVGAFFNLNPFLTRDGYHILVDLLRQPGLRERARRRLAHQLAGRELAADDAVILERYGLLGLAWSVLFAAAAIGLSLRYEQKITEVADVPDTIVHVVMGTLWLAFLTPAIVVLVPPLLERALRSVRRR